MRIIEEKGPGRAKNVINVPLPRMGNRGRGGRGRGGRDYGDERGSRAPGGDSQTAMEPNIMDEAAFPALS